MDGRLEGKVAVITGAASGIGMESAKLFVSHGARVVVADVQVDKGHEVVALLEDASPGSAMFVECDVTSEASVAATIDAAVDTWGQLDVMFNNAGVIGVVGSVMETDGADWCRTIDILLHSVFYGTKHAARAMKDSGAGSIISTTSIAGVIGGLGPHAYTTAKHAVIGLTKSAASELGDHGIRVNAIAPGSVPTAMTAEALMGDVSKLDAVAKQSLERYGRVSDARDIANAALYLASDDAGYVSGHTLVVDFARSVNGGSARFAGSGSKMMDVSGSN